MYAGEFEFHPGYFDKVAGSARVREALERNAEVEEIVGGFADGLAAFADLRRPYLLY